MYKRQVQGTTYRVAVDERENERVSYMPAGEAAEDGGRNYILSEQTSVLVTSTRKQAGNILLQVERDGADRWIGDDCVVTLQLQAEGVPLDLSSVTVQSDPEGHFRWIDRAEGLFLIGMEEQLTLSGLPAGMEITVLAAADDVDRYIISHRVDEGELTEGDALSFATSEGGTLAAFTYAARLAEVVIRQDRAADDRVIGPEDRFTFAITKGGWKGC